jgi:hypothetical protein
VSPTAAAFCALATRVLVVTREDTIDAHVWENLKALKVDANKVRHLRTRVSS